MLTIKLKQLLTSLDILATLAACGRDLIRHREVDFFITCGIFINFSCIKRRMKNNKNSSVSLDLVRIFSRTLIVGNGVKENTTISFSYAIKTKTAVLERLK